MFSSPMTAAPNNSDGITSPSPSSMTQTRPTSRPSASSAVAAAAAPISAASPSPYALTPYYQGGYGQDYHHHGMYAAASHHPHHSAASTMEAAAWHHAYNPLGHLYRDYEAAAAMNWPSSAAAAAAAVSSTTSSTSNPLPPSNHHPDLNVGVDPLQMSPLPASSSSAYLSSNGGDRAAPPGTPEYKLFNGEGKESGSADPAGAISSPEPGLAASDSGPGSPGGMGPPVGAMEGHLDLQHPQSPSSPYEWMKRPNFPAQRNSAKEGRTRTKDKYRVVYSDHQRLELEKEFHYSRYITIRRKAELAQALSLSERQVKIWFQNRRAKERKHMKKRDELIQKEKLDAAASLHAAAAAAHAAHAAAAATQPMFTPAMLHHHHPGMGGPL